MFRYVGIFANAALLLLLLPVHRFAAAQYKIQCLSPPASAWATSLTLTSTCSSPCPSIRADVHTLCGPSNIISVANRGDWRQIIPTIIICEGRVYKSKNRGQAEGWPNGETLAWWPVVRCVCARCGERWAMARIWFVQKFSSLINFRFGKFVLKKSRHQFLCIYVYLRYLGTTVSLNGHRNVHAMCVLWCDCVRKTGHRFLVGWRMEWCPESAVAVVAVSFRGFC